MDQAIILPVILTAVLAAFGACGVWVVRTLYATSVNLKGVQTEIKDHGARLLKLETGHAKISQTVTDVAVLTERTSHMVDALGRLEGKQSEVFALLSKRPRTPAG